MKNDTEIELNLNNPGTSVFSEHKNWTSDDNQKAMAAIKFGGKT